MISLSIRATGESAGKQSKFALQADDLVQPRRNRLFNHAPWRFLSRVAPSDDRSERASTIEIASCGCSSKQLLSFSFALRGADYRRVLDYEKD